MTAKILRSGPTIWRTARTLCAAAARSISSRVGRAGTWVIENPGGAPAPADARAGYGSRGRGLQIVELLARARDHRRQVRSEHDHVEAALHRPGRERRARAVHDGLDAVLVRRVADLVARGDVRRVRVVAARRQPQREREIGRPDVDGADPGRGAELAGVRAAFLR